MNYLIIDREIATQCTHCADIPILHIPKDKFSSYGMHPNKFHCMDSTAVKELSNYYLDPLLFANLDCFDDNNLVGYNLHNFSEEGWWWVRQCKRKGISSIISPGLWLISLDLNWIRIRYALTPHINHFLSIIKWLLESILS